MLFTNPEALLVEPMHQFREGAAGSGLWEKTLKSFLCEILRRLGRGVWD